MRGERLQRINAQYCTKCGAEGLSLRVLVCPNCDSTRLIAYREEDAVRCTTAKPQNT